MQCYNKKLDCLFPVVVNERLSSAFARACGPHQAVSDGAKMRSVMEASLLLYLRIIACPYLRFLQSASAPNADTPQTCALFCTHQKLNSFVFNRFRTLWQKHSGG